MLSVNGAQTLMFPDARPLVERLGINFFRQLPRRPGVYLMRDGAEAIVYVGKAKDLRQRLGNYRVANPDRVPKRLLRLLKCVVRIEYQECADEAAALAREAELLRELKPRFNRAGVWPAPPRFLLWRLREERLELRLVAEVEAGWEVQGPLKGGAAVMFATLVRVLWVMAWPGRALQEMPTGWFHGRVPEVVELPGETEVFLNGLLCGEFSSQESAERLSMSWQREVFQEDAEAVVKYFRRKAGT